MTAGVGSPGSAAELRALHIRGAITIPFREREGKVGLFPSAYVKELDSSNDSPKACACSDFYNSNGEGEISIRVGDVITILSTNDKDWWQGELNGRTGFFPSGYVKLLREKTGPTSSQQKKTIRINQSRRRSSTITPRTAREKYPSGITIEHHHRHHRDNGPLLD